MIKVQIKSSTNIIEEKLAENRRSAYILAAIAINNIKSRTSEDVSKLDLYIDERYLCSVKDILNLCKN